MMQISPTVFLFAGIAFIALAILITVLRFEWNTVEGVDIPEVIKNAKVWKREKLFLSRKKKLLCIPDITFRDVNNVVFLTELKTRKINKVYESDVLQLSVEHAVLESLGNRVSRTGFIKIQTEDGSYWHERNLLNGTEVDNVVKRYIDIKNGNIEPGKCKNTRICKSCEFNDVC